MTVSVDGIRPLDPTLLHEDTAEAELRGNRSDLSRVIRKEDAELLLLTRHLLRPAREPESAQWVIGGAGRDCVRLPAALLD